jgi:hypothetical protein
MTLKPKDGLERHTALSGADSLPLSYHSVYRVSGPAGSAD